jgi:DNA-binding NarL/FixJ family response regulator
MLELVCEGHTNREIAAALYISPSTAGLHVSNILRKLGATRRVDAAGVAHRLGLLPVS